MVLNFVPVDVKVKKAAAKLATRERLASPQDLEWDLFLHFYEYGMLEDADDPLDAAKDAWPYIRDKIRPLLSGKLFEDLGVDLAAATGTVPAFRARQRAIELPWVQPPPHWQARSRDFREDCRELREAIHGKLGISRALGLGEIEAFLRERLERMPRVGAQVGFSYPIGSGTQTKALRWATFWSGGDPGLLLLARVALELRMAFGCLEWEIIGFFLCDREFELPWLKAEVIEPSASNLAEVLEEAGLKVGTLPRLSRREISLVMEVGSPLLPAETLRKAYVQARRDLLEARDELGPETPGKPDRGSEAGKGPGERRVQRVRGQRASTLRLMEWVETGAARGLTWSQLFDQWPAQTGLPAYKTMASMQQTYYQGRKKSGEWHI